MTAIKVDDHVHDRANPIALGVVTKVLKTVIHVHFMSGVDRPYVGRYPINTKNLVREDRRS